MQSTLTMGVNATRNIVEQEVLFCSQQHRFIRICQVGCKQADSRKPEAVYKHGAWRGKRIFSFVFAWVLGGSGSGRRERPTRDWGLFFLCRAKAWLKGKGKKPKA
ncbi:MAG: hypothetical protein EOO03_16070 [Chitinophagaceae bacterium]|nr:MAG: hypothetical protein EOO03_16070 [Chitinophagaceae bacterium]